MAKVFDLFHKKRTEVEDESLLIGDQLDFIASEAYKKLRANILFSFSSDKHWNVIGVTSSLRGEGKSTTSINLAYSMAQLGKKVLLVESDLRLPSEGSKLSIENAKGLSDYLIGQATFEEAVNHKQFEKVAFDVLLSGTIPPNPSELLASVAYKDAIRTFKEAYDYVIVDFPPVAVVSDAVAASECIDGMVVVVRDDYCDLPSLKHTVKQLEFANVKILGFAYNAVSRDGGTYGKYGKYGKYSKYDRYYYGDHE